MKKQIFALLCAGFLVGCGAALTVTGSAEPAGETRPAVSQQEVKIYAAGPENLVKMGKVQVVTSVSVNSLDRIRLVLPELIKQAASIGANGIMLADPVVDPATRKETHPAEAIYVPK